MVGIDHKGGRSCRNLCDIVQLDSAVLDKEEEGCSFHPLSKIFIQQGGGNSLLGLLCHRSTSSRDFRNSLAGQGGDKKNGGIRKILQTLSHFLFELNMVWESFSIRSHLLITRMASLSLLMDEPPDAGILIRHPFLRI